MKYSNYKKLYESTQGCGCYDDVSIKDAKRMLADYLFGEVEGISAVGIKGDIILVKAQYPDDERIPREWKGYPVKVEQGGPVRFYDTASSVLPIVETFSDDSFIDDELMALINEYEMELSLDNPVIEFKPLNILMSIEKDAITLLDRKNDNVYKLKKKHENKFRAKDMKFIEFLFDEIMAGSFFKYFESY